MTYEPLRSESLIEQSSNRPMKVSLSTGWCSPRTNQAQFIHWQRFLVCCEKKILSQYREAGLGLKRGFRIRGFNSYIQSAFEQTCPRFSIESIHKTRLIFLGARECSWSRKDFWEVTNASDVRDIVKHGTCIEDIHNQDCVALNQTHKNPFAVVQ